MSLRRWIQGGLAGAVVAMAVLACAALARGAGEEEGVEPLLNAPTAPRTLEDVYHTVAIAGSVAFVTAVSILGAAYAVGKVGSAALGAAAEKPELLTRSILFVALAEGLAVLGFAVAMMLLTL